MTKYLISFPSSAMDFPEDVIAAASRDTRVVVQEAKDAGVWFFGGAIDEGVHPVMVVGDGSFEEGSYPETGTINGGYSILELPSHEDAVKWAAKFAVACRCAQEVRAFHFDPDS